MGRLTTQVDQARTLVYKSDSLGMQGGVKVLHPASPKLLIMWLQPDSADIILDIWRLGTIQASKQP